jgi:4-carboxymuconolactone decarboxylase
VLIKGDKMDNLTLKEISLVSLGASIGSNCIPCAVYHIKQCKISGLTDEQIKTAIDTAVKVKNVPAENVLATSLRQIGINEESSECGTARGCGCS